MSPPSCLRGNISARKSTCSVVSPRGVAWVWLVASQQTTVPPRFLSMVGAGGTAGTALGSGSVTSGRRRGGTLIPCSGQSCAGVLYGYVLE